MQVTLPEGVDKGLCTLFCSTVPNPTNASSYKRKKVEGKTCIIACQTCIITSHCKVQHRGSSGCLTAYIPLDNCQLASMCNTWVIFEARLRRRATLPGINDCPKSHFRRLPYSSDLMFLSVDRDDRAAVGRGSNQNQQFGLQTRIPGRVTNAVHGPPWANTKILRWLVTQGWSHILMPRWNVRPVYACAIGLT